MESDLYFLRGLWVGIVGTLLVGVLAVALAYKLFGRRD
jgi:hypothetical protein